VFLRQEHQVESPPLVSHTQKAELVRNPTSSFKLEASRSALSLCANSLYQNSSGQELLVASADGKSTFVVRANKAWALRHLCTWPNSGPNAYSPPLEMSQVLTNNSRCVWCLQRWFTSRPDTGKDVQRQFVKQFEEGFQINALDSNARM
jgi:hypothetical protein